MNIEFYDPNNPDKSVDILRVPRASAYLVIDTSDDTFIVTDEANLTEYVNGNPGARRIVPLDLSDPWWFGIDLMKEEAKELPQVYTARSGDLPVCI